MIKLFRFASVGFMIGLIGMSGCASGSGDAWTQVAPSAAGIELLQISGTVERLDLEGGVWVIRDEAGTRFNPVQLPDAFRSAGLRVEVEARRRDDLFSVGMVGPIIEVIRIRARR
jgi:hypothetical protein